jgi:eukaryotic translation initiation factor 2C
LNHSVSPFSSSLVPASILTLAGFLDHLLREWPTKQFAAIKRAFFFDKLGDDEELKQEFYQPLANMGASVYRGIYQAIKPTPVSFLLLV